MKWVDVYPELSLKDPNDPEPTTVEELIAALRKIPPLMADPDDPHPTTVEELLSDTRLAFEQVRSGGGRWTRGGRG